MGFLDFSFISNPFVYDFSFIPSSSQPIDLNYFLTSNGENFITYDNLKFAVLAT